MPEQRYRWKNKQLREHVAVLDGKLAPTILLKNAVYLNQSLRKWMQANIWIYQDRIVYVGSRTPGNMEKCETVDCTGRYLVPGYIEPHAHPFQLYNPLTFARYAAQFGTTTMINDNLVLFLQLTKKKAFSLMEQLHSIPSTLFWWCRFDGQTELLDEEKVFNHEAVKAWLEYDGVLQGGELTGWPQLLDGDDMMLHWIQEAKRMRKQVEGHFPGASEMTLAKMMLLGAGCDHEAMTGNEAMDRLMQGYTVSLRHSSIRPDLPRLLQELMELGVEHFDSFFFTTDGSPPSFHGGGFTDQLIQIAMDCGVPAIDAYNMASVNIAKYYHMEHLHGTIATGRIANINFLEAKDSPVPVSVLAKGRWVKREGADVPDETMIDWKKFGLEPLKLDWDIQPAGDFEFSMPFGIEMVNDVILKPYSIVTDVSEDELAFNHDECFFIMIGRDGKRRVNTILKGFADKLSGFCSSYSNSGDIVLIGKKQKDMVLAFNRMKEIGGGLVMAENGRIIFEMKLSLNGIMSEEGMDRLIEEERELKRLFGEKGYRFADPIYTLLFFSATHLPYIRVTQRGIYDVMNKTVLFPPIMR